MELKRKGVGWFKGFLLSLSRVCDFEVDIFEHCEWSEQKKAPVLDCRKSKSYCVWIDCFCSAMAGEM